MSRCHICMKVLPKGVFNPIGLCEQCGEPNEMTVTRVNVERPVISHENKTIMLDGLITEKKQNKKVKIDKKN